MTQRTHITVRILGPSAASNGWNFPLTNVLIERGGWSSCTVLLDLMYFEEIRPHFVSVRMKGTSPTFTPCEHERARRWMWRLEGKCITIPVLPTSQAVFLPCLLYDPNERASVREAVAS